MPYYLEYNRLGVYKEARNQLPDDNENFPKAIYYACSQMVVEGNDNTENALQNLYFAALNGRVKDTTTHTFTYLKATVADFSAHVCELWLESGTPEVEAYLSAMYDKLYEQEQENMLQEQEQARINQKQDY